jgi:hypothetical protein
MNISRQVSAPAALLWSPTSQGPGSTTPAPPSHLDKWAAGCRWHKTILVILVAGLWWFVRWFMAALWWIVAGLWFVGNRCTVSPYKLWWLIMDDCGWSYRICPQSSPHDSCNFLIIQSCRAWFFQPQGFRRFQHLPRRHVATLRDLMGKEG